MKVLTPLGAAGPPLEPKAVGGQLAESQPGPRSPLGGDPRTDDEHKPQEPSEYISEHHKRARRARRARPLSLPVLGGPTHRLKGVFKRSSLGFLPKTVEDISEGIEDELAGHNQVVSESDDYRLVNMDRRRTAMGPRAPMSQSANAAHSSDERTQAFESIFGRPSAAHRDMQPYGQPRPSAMNPGPQYQQHYPQQTYQPRQLQPQPPHQPQYARSVRTNEPAYSYQYSQQRSNYQPSYTAAGAGIITSPPPPPADPSLDFFISQGMTPAQAYQAQVFSNNQQRTGLPPGAHPHSNPNATTYASSQVSLNSGTPPRLDSLQPDGGKLSLDFESNKPNLDSTNRVLAYPGSMPDDSEGDSELPWANSGQRTPTSALQAARSGSQLGTLNTYSSSNSRNSATSSLVDIQDQRAVAPPKLSLDFGSPPSFSPNNVMDSTGEARPSFDSALTAAPMNQSNGSQAPHSESTSASSSYARRSLPSDSTRNRTPLSQLTFTQTNSSFSLTSGPATPLSNASNATRRSRRAPLVYPALLSRVAEALVQRISLSVRTKHGLSYPDSFDGQEAVDKICYIIKTTDRSLALLLGRALDAQKFFHDVTYDHRLRDNPNEIYQFRGNIESLALVGGGRNNKTHSRGDSQSLSPNNSFSGSSHRASMSKSSTLDTHSSASSNGYREHHTHTGTESTIVPYSNRSINSHTTHDHDDHSNQGDGLDAHVEGLELPTGVFTMLTECYSATCTREQLCYSITCPRRMEQQSRRRNRPGSVGGQSTPTKVARRATIGSQPPGDIIGTNGTTSPLGSASGHGHPQGGGLPRLGRAAEGDTVGLDDEDDAIGETGQLWIHTVPKEVADTLSDAEKKRQEAINEVIYTERDFVRDMEYLRDVWVAGIRNSDVIPAERRDEFISHVFWNILAIIDVNTRLRDALTKRQKQFMVVGEIGDILKDAVPFFEPFVEYGAHQMYGKYEFEKEKSSNPVFASWVEEIERLPESRKLELNGYLTKPTTRLARYPLLLDAVLKHTPDNSPDKVNIPEVIKMVRTFLTRVNQKTGEAENRFHLHQLQRQLAFRQGEYVDLKLTAPNRQMIYKGSLNRRGGAGDKEDLQVFLFDHALLIVKQKSKGDQYKVHRRPIPLEFLAVSAAEDPGSALTIRPSTNGRSGGRGALIKPQHDHTHSNLSGNSHTNGHNSPLSLTSARSALVGSNPHGFPITFTHLGWRGYTITLWASTFISKKKWLEHIQKQQELMRERSNLFETVPFAQDFAGSNRVNCAAPFRGGRSIVYGTDDGVYFLDLQDNNKPPMKMLALLEVTQVDVMESSQLLIVLSERSVLTFPLEALEARDPTAGLKRGQRIAAHTSFFKVGVCIDKSIVCVVKTSPLSTTVKTFEPVDQNVRGKSKPTFKKLLQGGNDTLKLFKEFYIPVECHSLTILRSRLCIGCARGFQILDLESLDTQPLVDPSDPSMDFIEKRENLRPLAIFKVDTDFLLCYEEWAIFVDRHGFRARGNWIANWEGRPTAFAYHYPYVMAIEPSFIEIWDVTTCTIRQVILGDNFRCLFAEPPVLAPGHVNPHQVYPNAPLPPRTSSSTRGTPQIGQHQYMHPVQQHGSPAMYGGRPSMQGVPYPGQPGYPHIPPTAPGHDLGRRLTLIGSDDSMMILRPVAQSPGSHSNSAPPQRD